MFIWPGYLQRWSIWVCYVKYPWAITISFLLMRNMNKSAKKRFLFLTDLLDLEWTAEHERKMKELGTGISLLDPAAPDQGIKMRKFGLKINADPIRIKMAVLHRKIS